MHPEICRIGPFAIYSYGLMLATAFIVSSFLASRRAESAGIPPETILNLSFVVFVFGIAGARLLYVVQNIKGYVQNPAEILMLQHGGLSLFGGLILGSIAGIIYMKRKKLSAYKALDVLAPYIALGQAIGRIGCLLNGCCYGKPAVWGIWFPAHQAVLVPTQIYSSLPLLGIFMILRVLQDRPHIVEGEIFFTYLLLYSLKRFFIEFWRGDTIAVIPGLTLFQVFSIALFLLAVIQLVRFKHPTS